ncbi:ferric uptake regulator, partial [Proteus mirabilis]
DLYKKLIDIGEEIGLATVYRVLNQFDDAGIVTRHNFEGGKSVFELTQQHHHDHLICLDCGKVIEFTDDAIEVRQRNIAERHGIKLSNHSLYLYGHCAEGNCKEDSHAHDEK